MIERNEREDERLGLSRRSFFFFGAILAARPEIVVPEPAVWPSAGRPEDDNFKHAIFSLTLSSPCLLRIGEKIHVWDGVSAHPTGAVVEWVKARRWNQSPTSPSRTA